MHIGLRSEPSKEAWPQSENETMPGPAKSVAGIQPTLYVNRGQGEISLVPTVVHSPRLWLDRSALASASFGQTPEQ